MNTPSNKPSSLDIAFYAMGIRRVQCEILIKYAVDTGVNEDSHAEARHSLQLLRDAFNDLVAITQEASNVTNLGVRCIEDCCDLWEKYKNFELQTLQISSDDEERIRARMSKLQWAIQKLFESSGATHTEQYDWPLLGATICILEVDVPPDLNPVLKPGWTFAKPSWEELDHFATELGACLSDLMPATPPESTLPYNASRYGSWDRIETGLDRLKQSVVADMTAPAAKPANQRRKSKWSDLYDMHDAMRAENQNVTDKQIVNAYRQRFSRRSEKPTERTLQNYRQYKK